MAKKKIVVVDDTEEESILTTKFEFVNPKDTLSGYFIEMTDDGKYLFETDEDSPKQFILDEFPQLVKTLDYVINGKKVREQDFLIEITYLGVSTKDGKSYPLYLVTVE